MRSVVIFDTTLGSTQKVAAWIREGIGENTELKKADEVESLNYDLIVIGSPIYNQKPLRTIVDFLQKNQTSISKRKVALFLVCGDHPFPEYSSRVQKYLQDFARLVNKPIDIKAFGGYLDLKSLDETTQKNIVAFWNSRGWFFEIMDNLNREEALEYGKKLKTLYLSD